MTASAPRIANRYEIDVRLGSGVSGQSFRCRDLDAGGTLVVVKLAHDDGISQASVQAEARVLDLLGSGPRTGGRAPCFYDRGVHDYRPYLVQELVGIPHAQLAPSSRLGMVEIWRLWLELCGLLARAHRLGFVHGDLGGSKLEHLWWHRQPDGPSPRLVVIDWGNTCWPGDPVRASALGFGDDMVAVATTVATLATGTVVEMPEEARLAINRARLPWPDDALTALLGALEPPAREPSRAFERITVTVANLVEHEERRVRAGAMRDGRTSRELNVLRECVRNADCGDAALPWLDAELEVARKADVSRWLEQVNEAITQASQGDGEAGASRVEREATRFLEITRDPDFVTWLERTERDPARRCSLGLPVRTRTIDVEGEIEDLRDLLAAACRCLPSGVGSPSPDARAAWLQALARLNSSTEGAVSTLLLDQLLPEGATKPLLRVDLAHPQHGTLVAGRLAGCAGWPPAGRIEAAVRSLPGSSRSDHVGSGALAPPCGWGTIPQGPVRWFVDLAISAEEATSRLTLYEDWARSLVRGLVTYRPSTSDENPVSVDAEPVLDGFVRALDGPDAAPDIKRWLSHDPRVAPLVRARLQAMDALAASTKVSGAVPACGENNVPARNAPDAPAITLVPSIAGTPARGSSGSPTVQRTQVTRTRTPPSSDTRPAGTAGPTTQRPSRKTPKIIENRSIMREWRPRS